MELDSTHAAAMQKLEFLEGKWEGNGWMTVPGGKKVSFDQTEDIQYKLGKAILTIEGTGKIDDQIVHHAFAVVSCDPDYSDYNFRTYLANGLGGKFTAELKNDCTFVWHTNARQREIRYAIRIEDNTHWYEIEEIKRGDK